MSPGDSTNRRRVRGPGVASSLTECCRNRIAHSTFVCDGLLVPTTNRSKRILLVSSWRASNHDAPTVRFEPTLWLRLTLCLQPVGQAVTIDAAFRFVYFVRARGNVGFVGLIRHARRR